MKSSNRAKTILGTICSMIGVIFIIAGVFMTVSVIRFRQSAIETTAEIVEISKTHHTDSEKDTIYSVSVSYKVDDDFYSRSYTTTAMKQNEGDYITIYYDKNDPNKIRRDISIFSGIAMVVGGVLFGMVGFALIIDKLNKESKIEE